MNNPSNSWFQFADTDLRSAEFLLNMYPQPIEIICYHCEQAAEKMLKGVLVANNIEPLKTHDLMDLCKRCSAIDQHYEGLMENCADLTPCGVQARYPSEMELDENDMMRALRMCRELCNAVELQMGLREEPEEELEKGPEEDPGFGEMRLL